MRDLVSLEQLRLFMSRFGRSARSDVRIYLTGGSTAVLSGWRESTIDIDLKFEPESDELYRSIPELKESLRINIELAAPSDFIPELPGWRERCILIAKEGNATFYQYDPYSQALSKIERDFEQDRKDVISMLGSEMIKASRLLQLFEEIEPILYKYPAIDPATFRQKVLSFVDQE